MLDFLLYLFKPCMVNTHIHPVLSSSILRITWLVRLFSLFNSGLKILKLLPSYLFNPSQVPIHNKFSESWKMVFIELLESPFVLSKRSVEYLASKTVDLSTWESWKESISILFLGGIFNKVCSCLLLQPIIAKKIS